MWNTTQKECYAVCQSIQKFSFYLADTKCTLYCNNKLLAVFVTSGMSSPVLNCWTLELQQFDIQFKHILGKNTVVADIISRLRTLGLYYENGNNIATTDDDVVEKLIEEAHAIELVPNSAGYNMEKLNLDAW